MFTIAVERVISMAHRLHNYDGPCARIHGHNWKFRAEVKAETLDEIGISIDFADLDALLGEIIQPFDHNLINQVAPFDTLNPTAENLVKFIFEELKSKLPSRVRLYRVSAWETDSCMVSYEEE